MKKTILSFLLVITSVITFAQRVSSRSGGKTVPSGPRITNTRMLHINKDSVGFDSMLSKWSDSSLAHKGGFEIIPISNDTVAVVMMVVDTTISDRAYAMKGFSITPYGYINSGIRVQSDSSFYVDKFKQPLKKSVIVWQSLPR
jgi:hypothetical protein